AGAKPASPARAPRESSGAPGAAGGTAAGGTAARCAAARCAAAGGVPSAAGVRSTIAGSTGGHSADAAARPAGPGALVRFGATRGDGKGDAQGDGSDARWCRWVHAQTVAPASGSRRPRDARPDVHHASESADVGAATCNAN